MKITKKDILRRSTVRFIVRFLKRNEALKKAPLANQQDEVSVAKLKYAVGFRHNKHFYFFALRVMYISDKEYAVIEITKDGKRVNQNVPRTLLKRHYLANALYG